MVLALNFMDEVQAHGDKIDIERLSRELGVPVVPITARTGEGLDELLAVAHRQMHLATPLSPTTYTMNSPTISTTGWASLSMTRPMRPTSPPTGRPSSCWRETRSSPKLSTCQKDTQKKLDQIIAQYEASSDLGDRETLIADSRYQYIERVVKASVVKGNASGRPTLSQRIDRIVTGKYTALPLFLCAMLVMFVITFGPFGSWLQDGVSASLTCSPAFCGTP